MSLELGLAHVVKKDSPTGRCLCRASRSLSNVTMPTARHGVSVRDEVAGMLLALIIAEHWLGGDE